MLKPSSPIPQTETPANAGGLDAAPPQGDTVSGGPKAPRRYEVPEADALSELPIRPHANTVRGQIQRVRLDLLARENERLDHQLREVREQQKEYQEKDSAWREGWQKRLLDLSEQVDHLITEAEAAREAEPEQDEGPELRDTVKPLLLAVLEMLDDTDGQGRPARPDTARPAKPIALERPEPPAALQPPPVQTAPAAPPAIAEPDQPIAVRPAAPVPDEAEDPSPTAEATGLGPLADQALRQSRPSLATIGRMESWDPVVPAPQADVPDISPPQPVEDGEPVAAKEPSGPEPGQQALNDTGHRDIFDRAQESSLDDENTGDDMAIEIARLLLPQGDAGVDDTGADNTGADDAGADDTGADDDLALEPQAEAEKAVPRTAPEPQDNLPEEADHLPGTLELGTNETPELLVPEPKPEPAVAEAPKPKTAQPSLVEDPQPKPPQRREGVPSRFAASGLGGAAADSKPVAGGQPRAGGDAKASDSGSPVRPPHPEPEPEPEIPTEPLPRCLTERWEDEGSDPLASSARGQPAQRRDTGSYRWPFRRLRATIDHDHAHADPETEPRRISRPRGKTRFGEKLE